MPRQFGFIRPILILAVVFSLPASVMGRGGGGGGHGGGGGGGIGRGGGGAGRVVGGGRFVGVRGGGFGSGFHSDRGFRGHFPGYRGYGWGSPYYGYGLGLGLGLGLGYGLTSGYGYPGYAYGYPGYAYGNGVTSGVTVYDPALAPVAVSSPVVTASATAPDDASVSRSKEFGHQGETSFKKGNYSGAVYAWRHAVVDDPQNSIVVMELGLALFATGKYEEAAGATQAAIRALPKENWGTVVRHYQEIYGNQQDYTHQLRALEKAVSQKPNDPALRFLAGFHYGYLGFLPQSIEQLEHAVSNEPRDEVAKQLLDEMKSRLLKAELQPPVPSPAKEISWKKSR